MTLIQIDINNDNNLCGDCRYAKPSSNDKRYNCALFGTHYLTTTYLRGNTITHTCERLPQCKEAQLTAHLNPKE